MSYTPENPPVKLDSEYLFRELTRISAELDAMKEQLVEEVYRPPERPRDGMIRLIDGDEWNPGQGKGLHYRQGGRWYKITAVLVSEARPVTGAITIAGQTATIT